MFATAAPIHNPSAFTSVTNAYRQVGVQTGVGSASAHQLVQMLFDACHDALAQARGAIATGDVQAKGRAIGRAARIVEEGLKACLNLDAGGTLATDLNALYAYIGVRLTQANLGNDAATLEECGRLLEPLRSAWAAIGPQVATSHQ
ncbi:MAG: flagellar export chaperone FliS [Burkholderiales bacterium]